MPTAEERFFSKIAVNPETDCWEWTGATGGPGYREGRGYSVFYYEGRAMQGHRASYMMFVGPIPEGMAIDHLCRVRLCVNPAHLEPVTTAENNRRQKATVTHCPQGHLYDEANTYISPKGGRGCRACRRDQSYRVRQRQGKPVPGWWVEQEAARG